jgi:hypothetical protein
MVVVYSAEQLDYLFGYESKPEARPDRMGPEAPAAGHAEGGLEPTSDVSAPEPFVPGEQAGGAAPRLDQNAISRQGEEDSWDTPGRQWLVFGTAHVPWAEQQTADVIMGSWAFQVRRAVRGLRRAAARKARKERDRKTAAARLPKVGGAARKRRREQRENPRLLKAVNRGGFRAVGYTREVARLVDHFTGGVVCVRESVLAPGDWMRAQVVNPGRRARGHWSREERAAIRGLVALGLSREDAEAAVRGCPEDLLDVLVIAEEEHAYAAGG